MPLSGWLKQRTFISYSSEAWGIQDQGAGRFCSWRGPASWLADVAFPLGMYAEREKCQGARLSVTVLRAARMTAGWVLQEVESVLPDPWWSATLKPTTLLHQ